MAFNNPTLVEQQIVQLNRIATLNRGQTSAPSDLFRTRDGWIIAYAIGEPMFKRWAKLMGEDHWLTDPRFKDDHARGDHGEIISKRMSEWTAERTTAQALAELEKAKIPAGPLYSPQQALEDAHIRAAGLLTDSELSRACRVRCRWRRRRSICRRRPGRFRHRAPTLGEHTDAILTELGYDAAAIADFRTRGVI